MFKILLFLISFSVLAGPGLYKEAPRNGFIYSSVTDPLSLELKERFKESSSTAYSADQLDTLVASDFVDLENIHPRFIRQARDLFRAKKIVIVDSVVGNATRLGNPPGGKGAVEIAKQITFLESKIIRLAVESKLLGVNIPQVLWTSEENRDAVYDILENMSKRVKENPAIKKRVKKAILQYLKGQNITIMAQATLLPVIDHNGDLSDKRMRNLGAGELIPTLYRSGVTESLGIDDKSMVIFSNIDFDVSYLEVVAGNLQANRPDLMQVHVPTKASGGSAYWVEENGQRRIIPLEEIEVPQEVLERITTLNSNTVVLQGNALNPKLYNELPLPFEKKIYDGQYLYLPKLSLSDIGKHPDIVSAVAKGRLEKYFFSGSKNLAQLREQGRTEINHRIERWQSRINTTFDRFIMRKTNSYVQKNFKSCSHSSSKVLLAR
jgi:hypothetical protein